MKRLLFFLSKQNIVNVGTAQYITTNHGERITNNASNRIITNGTQGLADNINHRIRTNAGSYITT